MGCEDVDDVFGVVVVFQKVYIDVEVAVVLGVCRVNAGNKVVFDNYGVECVCSRLEEERVLEVLPGGWVVEVDRVCGKVVAVESWR